MANGKKNCLESDNVFYAIALCRKLLPWQVFFFEKLQKKQYL